MPKTIIGFSFPPIPQQKSTIAGKTCLSQRTTGYKPKKAIAGHSFTSLSAEIILSAGIPTAFLYIIIPDQQFAQQAPENHSWRGILIA